MSTHVLIVYRISFCPAMVAISIALSAPAGCLWASDTVRADVRRGPIYVPLDSWIYPALKRLAALGYAPDAESLVAPWTRQQCGILADEAEDIASRRSTKLSAGALNAEALQLIDALKQEFGTEEPNRASAHVESLYTRLAQISGTPLRDSYHFGQTIVDDYGRPYAEGANTVAGFSAYGTAGRFSGYFRAEYQEAPSTLAYTQGVRDFIALADGIPTPPNTSAARTNRFDPLEAYLGAQLLGFDVTIGKQSLWWGPGETTAFHFSQNAEPLYALRFSQSAPIMLPGPFRLLGRIRTQFLWGRMTGHEFPPGPWINAQKVTLQLTQDFEVGFTRSAIFGGAGHPLTVGSFLASLLSVSTSGGPFGSADPGDRRSGFDFRWHLPKLRRYVTLYSDSLADDEPNPLDSPRRSAWGPGVYVTQLPRIPHLDLRFETYSTWLYRGDAGGRFIYWNDEYHDAYTNNGSVLGSWVGRDARAYTASSTYWWSAKNRITASFRQVKSGNKFLPGGGTQTDASLAFEWQLRPEVLANVFVQGERYLIPILGGPHNDVAVGLGVTFSPKSWASHVETPRD